jgi:hypothetical protein
VKEGTLYIANGYFNASGDSYYSHFISFLFDNSVILVNEPNYQSYKKMIDTKYIADGGTHLYEALLQTFEYIKTHDIKEMIVFLMSDLEL